MTYANKLEWKLYKPLSESYIKDDSISKEQLFAQANPFPEITKIVVLSFSGIPLLVEEQKCETIGDILKTIEQNMDKPIEYSFDQRDFFPEIYKYIGGFWDKQERLVYIKSLEDRELKPKDILANYVFFGGLYAEDGMIWYEYES
jgi:hypothetical protein